MVGEERLQQRGALVGQHPGHHLRPVVEPNAENGLRIQSQIMTEKLMPIRRDRIRRVLGSLDPLSMDQLDRALFVVLGLAR